MQEVSKTGRRKTIIEEKSRLNGSRTEWECEVLALDEGRHAVLRYVLENDRPIAGTDLVLHSGTVTIAHYWMDRPFNIYHLRYQGQTIAFYCNISTMTEITARRIAFLDLTVDVLLRPSGSLDVLDEDELPDDLDSRHRKTIADALERIVANPRGIIQEIERASAPYP